jgi:type IX secretion system PorP/SprF family membrane protein
LKVRGILKHKKMKKLIIAIVCFTSSIGAFAQAKPAYSQYVLNNYILNPAMAGIENYTDIKISNRNQWVGINGAPRTTYISIHGPIGKSDYNTSATSFAVPGTNPRGPEYWRDYETSDPHHGVGFTASSDKTGYISRWNMAASYAYHRPISKRTTLSAGFTAGISGINLDRSKATFADNIPDLAFGNATSDLKKVKPEFGAGLWLYSARYFAGISVLNIIPGKAKFTTADNYGTYFTPNYFISGGYRFSLGEDFTLIPSVMMQYWQPQLIGAHANAKLQYMDKAWVGGAYRYSDFLKGYSAMAGFYVSNILNLSYTYEVATESRLRTYTGNTHEIMVGFTLGNKYSDACPRNIF